jgi:proteic killer suppression protein
LRYRFYDKGLERLYVQGTGAGHYPEGIAETFVKRIRMIEAAADERDLRALKSLHFEKLKGGGNRYSIRLNQTWRLLLTFEKDKDGKIVVIIEINKHYGD